MFHLVHIAFFLFCSISLCDGFGAASRLSRTSVTKQNSLGTRLTRLSSTTFDSQPNTDPVANKKSVVNENPVVAFFEAWNTRDIEAAASYFALNCVYEDTSFPNKFYGRTDVKKHLIKNAEGFPDGTIIKIDKVSGVGAPGANIGVQWHVECKGVHLPSARGCSMYILDEEGLIVEGIDVLEPIPKVGELALKASKAIVTAGKLAQFYKPKK